MKAEGTIRSGAIHNKTKNQKRRKSRETETAPAGACVKVLFGRIGRR
jgi:hypothetical protein